MIIPPLRAGTAAPSAIAAVDDDNPTSTPVPVDAAAAVHCHHPTLLLLTMIPPKLVPRRQHCLTASSTATHVDAVAAVHRSAIAAVNDDNSASAAPLLSLSSVSFLIGDQ